MKQVQALKSHLHSTFSIKDLGVLTYFFGMKIGYTGGTTLSQAKFTREIFGR